MLGVLLIKRSQQLSKDGTLAVASRAVVTIAVFVGVVLAFSPEDGSLAHVEKTVVCQPHVTDVRPRLVVNVVNGPDGDDFPFVGNIGVNSPTKPGYLGVESL